MQALPESPETNFIPRTAPPPPPPPYPFSLSHQSVHSVPYQRYPIIPPPRPPPASNAAPAMVARTTAAAIAHGNFKQIFAVYFLCYHCVGVTVGIPFRSDVGSTAIQIGVPESMLGSIIGRGGSTIKEIITETGASILVRLQF